MLDTNATTDVATPEGVLSSDCSTIKTFNLVLDFCVLCRVVCTCRFLYSPVLLLLSLAPSLWYVIVSLYLLQCNVVRVPDARVVQLGGLDLILWHFLRRGEGGQRQKSTLNEHVDC